MSSARLLRKAGLAVTAVSAIVVGLPAVGSAADSAKVISYPSFKKSAGLTLNGSAAIGDGTYKGNGVKVLRLTDGGGNEAGSAWSATKISPSAGSFKAIFEVSNYHNGGTSHADGVAFVLQPGGLKTLGRIGGGIGYAGVAPSVAIEFDTFRNTAYGETDDNHVSIVTGGLAETPEATAQSPIPLFGTAFRGTVTYNASTMLLRVYLNSLNNAGGGKLVLSKKVKLSTILGTGDVFAGFTGATGTSASTQDILKWSVTVTK